ncbi:hypothetical protein ACF0H5_005639 [Mactra antiquata]
MEKRNVEKPKNFNRKKTNTKAPSSVINSDNIADDEVPLVDSDRRREALNGENIQHGNIHVCNNFRLNEECCGQHQDKRKVCEKRSGGGKDLRVAINGIDSRLNGDEYSRTVCNVYRHENDLIFGRMRGGVLNNGRETHETCVNDDRDTSLSAESSNGYSSENAEKEQLFCISDESETTGEHLLSDEQVGIMDTSNNTHGNSSNAQRNGILAPLASPESLSDEDSGDGNEIENLSPENFSCPDEQKDDSPSSPQSQNDDSELQDEGVNDCVLDESIDSEELNPELENNEEVHCTTTNGAPKDDESVDSDIECLMENGDLEEENEIENQVVEVGATDIDNNDDVGDFIEADLPPNVERLVFFSRDSTSDEDEGCGDEVLPNNDEDVISDNETIDPTDSVYSSLVSGRNSNSDQPNHGMSNALSGNDSGIRGEMCNIHPCNISCDKSTEDNNADCGMSSSCSCAEECGVGDCMSCNMLNNCDDSSMSTDSASAKLSCACCDKSVHIDCDRQRELGVNICDKCFMDLLVDQRQGFDGGSKHRSQPGSSSGTNYLNRNCRNTLMPSNNNHDKVSNNSLGMIRFSSSDSDPYDRLYVSDSSELFSPDTENCSDSLFQTSMASDGTMVQSAQFSDGRNRFEGRPLHRQSMSLDYTSPSELFSTEYNTRRSRSLDQQLLRRLSQVHADESGRPHEEPNNTSTSSNFQNDESSVSHRLFYKQAFNVPLSKPNCSSSDEEENMRMPGVNHMDYNSDMFELSDLAANLEVPNDMLYGSCSKDKLSRGQKMRLDDEPIYEDIEQLELLIHSNDKDTSENTSVVQPTNTSTSKLKRRRCNRSPVSDVEKVMIWNEYEAYVVQVKQIGTSACGPTAVLNVLKAFDFQVDKEEVTSTIRSNLRMEAAPIPYYLFSRYNAGTTAQDLVDGVTAVTRGTIKGRFFHFYPPREVELLKWLGFWMKKGAVPVATLNLQRGVKKGWTIPDAWHHQMVYGVSCKGIYLTNPLEIVPESVIMEQLTSDSVLLVRRQDVVGRFRDWCPLNEIIKQRDLRWRTMNVLGQIVHILREQSMYPDQMVNMKSLLTSHIKIPAAYKAGIILFMRANSENIDELMSAPELPLKPEPVHWKAKSPK